MTKLHSFLLALRVLSKLGLSCVMLCGIASGQIFGQDIEIRVHNLPSLMARTPSPSDVLLTSLHSVFHDHEVCCGKDSALGDAAEAADLTSLKDVASDLQGRHLLSDGRPIMVTAEYVAPDAVTSGHLISLIMNQHALLTEWKSHVYVVHGVVYVWVWVGGQEGGRAMTGIHKFLLWDTRYSDSRRNMVFDRLTDDLNTVQGLLFVEAKPQ